VIGHYITEIIYRALSKVAPDKVIAASGAHLPDECILREKK